MTRWGYYTITVLKKAHFIYWNIDIKAVAKENQFTFENWKHECVKFICNNNLKLYKKAY